MPRPANQSTRTGSTSIPRDHPSWEPTESYRHFRSVTEGTTREPAFDCSG